MSMDRDFQIRLATPQDADAIAHAHVRSWRATYAGIFPEHALQQLSVSEHAGYWRRMLQDSTNRAFVADIDGTVGGFACLIECREPDIDLKSGIIESLYIAPEYWRRGYGRALVLKGILLAAQNDWCQLVLWILAKNTSARQFYKALGFQEDKVSREGSLAERFKNAEPISVELLRLRLDLVS